MRNHELFKKEKKEKVNCTVGYFGAEKGKGRRNSALEDITRLGAT